MPLSLYTPCSHAVKNTLWSKEETDNTPKDKTVQVTSGKKQGLGFKISHNSDFYFCQSCEFVGYKLRIAGVKFL